MHIVAPLAGAWIEILITGRTEKVVKVAPLAGAWIEISVQDKLVASDPVAPLAGAWIEIPMRIFRCFRDMSLPSRERGLKSQH